LLDQGTAIARGLGDDWGLLRWLNRQADAACDRGDFATQTRFAEETLALARRLGDRLGVGLALNQLSRAAFYQGRLADARRTLAEVEAAFPLSGPTRGSSVSGVPVRFFGHLAVAEGDWAEARRRFGAMMRHSVGRGRPFLVAYALDDLAVLAAAEGRSARALRLAGASTTLRQQHRARRHPPWRDYLERWLGPARAELGAAAQAADREGQAMSLDEAIAYALGDAD
jgi:hypothetical protein